MIAYALNRVAVRGLARLGGLLRRVRGLRALVRPDLPAQRLRRPVQDGARPAGRPVPPPRPDPRPLLDLVQGPVPRRVRAQRPSGVLLEHHRDRPGTLPLAGGDRAAHGGRARAHGALRGRGRRRLRPAAGQRGRPRHPRLRLRLVVAADVPDRGAAHPLAGADGLVLRGAARRWRRPLDQADGAAGGDALARARRPLLPLRPHRDDQRAAPTVRGRCPREGTERDARRVSARAPQRPRPVRQRALARYRRHRRRLARSGLRLRDGRARGLLRPVDQPRRSVHPDRDRRRDRLRCRGVRRAQRPRRRLARPEDAGSSDR